MYLSIYYLLLFIYLFTNILILLILLWLLFYFFLCSGNSNSSNTIQCLTRNYHNMISSFVPILNVCHSCQYVYCFCLVLSILLSTCFCFLGFFFNKCFFLILIYCCLFHACLIKKKQKNRGSVEVLGRGGCHHIFISK